MAGIAPVRISDELFALIERSQRVSAMTGGAFDISGTLSRYYWTFDRREHRPLAEERIIELRELINYQLIELNESEKTVFLRQRGMKIGFGGIGKGYAAIRACEVMKGLGINNGLINASGDLLCWGRPPRSNAWSINIPDPKDRTNSLLQFSIPEGSVVTSGNFENYTIINGKRYSHIIDPRTGRPAEGTKQVSVVCPNPELADAMATAISVLGAEQGISLVNRLNGVECIVIDEQDHIHYSNQLKPTLNVNSKKELVQI